MADILTCHCPVCRFWWPNWSLPTILTSLYGKHYTIYIPGLHGHPCTLVHPVHFVHNWITATDSSRGTPIGCHDSLFYYLVWIKPENGKHVCYISMNLDVKLVAKPVFRQYMKPGRFLFIWWREFTFKERSSMSDSLVKSWKTTCLRSSSCASFFSCFRSLYFLWFFTADSAHRKRTWDCTIGSYA